MTAEIATKREPKVPLSRERVLGAAIEVADRGGLESLTMRRLAQELGVEAMSLYYHVANKDEVLDGMIEALIEEINGQVAGLPTHGDWKRDLREHILTARQVFLRHPWAPGVLETRTTMSGPVLIYFDSVLGLMRSGGFSYDLAHHALHALGSRALGFTQELFDPGDDGGAAEEEANELMAEMSERAPHLIEMMMEISHDDPDSTLGWCDDQVEFEFGLDLVLDGLEGALARNSVDR
jgi:AcrR family transcriptional regulator